MTFEAVVKEQGCLSAGRICRSASNPSFSQLVVHDSTCTGCVFAILRHSLHDLVSNGHSVALERGSSSTTDLRINCRSVCSSMSSACADVRTATPCGTDLQLSHIFTTADSERPFTKLDDNEWYIEFHKVVWASFLACTWRRSSSQSRTSMVKLFGCRTHSIISTDTLFCNPKKKRCLIHGTTDISFLTSSYSLPAKSAWFYNQYVRTWNIPKLPSFLAKPERESSGST
jgi:hypothetical protein